MVTIISDGGGDRRIVQNKAVHDRVAARYDRHHTEIFNKREQARLRAALEDAIGQIRPAKVNGAIETLDLGCGSGNLTRHLLTLGCAVTAADVSHKFLALVQGRFGSNQLLRTVPLNGINLAGFDDASFDLIATYSVLHHIPDYLAIVREMARVCRPGGVVYIDHEPTEESWRPSAIYKQFVRRATKPNYSKWFQPINYYGKFRRLFNPRFANEGDIHVWPDDHVQWSRVIEALGDGFEPILDHSYLLYNGRYRSHVYDEYVHQLTDTRTMAFRKR